jgi:hypothetical protein
MNELLVPCVDYADYLAVTLPFNSPHFGHVIVVTPKADIKESRGGKKDRCEGRSYRGFV